MTEVNNNAKRATAAFRIALLLAGVLLLSLIGAIRALPQIPELLFWQRLAPATAVGLALAASLLCAWLSRRGRTVAGVTLMLTALTLVPLAVALAVVQRATIFALIVMIIVFVVSAYTLTKKQANYVIFLTTSISMLTVILDWLGVAPRPAPDVTPIPLILISLAAVILGIAAGIRFRTLQLRVKLIFLFTAIPVLIVMLTGSFFIYQISSRLDTDIKQRNLLDSKTAGEQIQSFLSTGETDIRFLSQSAVLANYLKAVDTGADPATLAELRDHVAQEFYAFAQARQIYDQIRFIDAAGQEVIRINTGADGVSAIVPEDELQNKSGRYYFEDTMQLAPGELMISPLDLNVERGEIETPHKPVLRYGTPVVVNGQTMGVVVTNILADNILDILAARDIPSFLIDRDGYYLYHPDVAKRWGRDLGTGITIMDDVPEMAAWLPKNEPGVVETAGQLIAFQPLTLSGEAEPRWYTGNFVPVALAQAPVSQALASGIAVLALALLATPLLAIGVSQTISRPIVRLTDLAQKAAAGDLTVEAAVRRGDEIGVLARSFNVMIGQLRHSITSLEDQVRARTRDLLTATQVGSNLSRIRDLNRLLEESVEIIGQQFDLYYTQIYLLDEQARLLRLKAGSGQIGRELLRREHRLPVNPGSINGTAVLEKRPIVVQNTAESAIFQPNELLPLTRSEVAIPLVTSDRIWGTLNLQSDEPNSFTEENTLIFETLAAQLAIAIENASLFMEITEARAVLDAYTRRLTRENWQAYLNAVDRPEQIAWTYDAEKETVLPGEPEETAAGANVWQIPVTVGEETIGVIQVEAESSHSKEMAALLQAAGQQIGSHLESLRLLDEAERYRLEAEAAARRLAHEGWEVFLQDKEVVGYEYEGANVRPLDQTAAAGPETAASAARYSLTAHGQPVGRVEIIDPPAAGEAETEAFLAAIADSLSRHIENLRLTEQMEKALAEARRREAEAQALNRVAEAAARQLDRETMLKTIVAEMERILPMDAFLIGIYDAGHHLMEYPLVYDDGEYYRYEPAEPAPDSHVMRVLQTGKPILLNRTPEEVAAVARRDDSKMMGDTQKVSATLLYTPLQAGGRILGVLSVQSYQYNAFTSSDVALITSIAGYVAIALENARLLAEAENQARQEQILREITARVHTAVNAENILKTAAKEIQRAFGVEAFVYLDAAPEPTNGNQK